MSCLLSSMQQLVKIFGGSNHPSRVILMQYREVASTFQRSWFYLNNDGLGQGLGGFERKNISEGYRYQFRK